MKQTLGVMLGAVLAVLLSSTAVFAAPDQPQSQGSPSATIAVSVDDVDHHNDDSTTTVGQNKASGSRSRCTHTVVYEGYYPLMKRVCPAKEERMSYTGIAYYQSRMALMMHQ